MPSARVFGPWPEHSNPAASCLQSSCALQTEAVDTAFFLACAHLTRGRCCTSNLIAPCITDKPPPEVAAAGHDRCIVPIKPENIDSWLNPDPSRLAAMHAILDDRDRPFYEHQLAA